MIDTSDITLIYLYIGLCILAIALLSIIIKTLNLRSLLKQRYTLLELTPPSIARKTPLATSQFFSVLHSIVSSRTFMEMLLGRKTHISLEVISSRKQGIRYLARIPDTEVDIFKQQIAAYLPDVRFKKIKDYLNSDLAEDKYIHVSEYKQARHFAYPLADSKSLTEHDPIAYITGSMTKLEPDELISFQVILSPEDSRESTSINNKLILGQDVNLSRKDPNNRGRDELLKQIRSLWLGIRSDYQTLIGVEQPKISIKKPENKSVKEQNDA